MTQKYKHAVERIRNACLLALVGMTVAVGLMGYATDNWRPVMLVLPFGLSLILMWYLEARLTHLRAEVANAIEDQNRARNDGGPPFV